MSYVISKSFEDIAQPGPGRCSESTPSSHPSRHDPSVHLPAELLVEIFDMCSPPGEDGFDGLSETTTSAQEVERLAKQYLLQLSQVCTCAVWIVYFASPDYRFIEGLLAVARPRHGHPTAVAHHNSRYNALARVEYISDDID
jgi:hypothetical protein